MAVGLPRQEGFNFMEKKHRSKPKTEYGVQFSEKQAVKRSYGIRETQFRRYFKRGSTPARVFETLERRLDNVVYRAGFASTRKSARQLVTHGHFTVNGKNTDIPSYTIKNGDVIAIHPSSKSKVTFKDLELLLKKYEPPTWIEVDKGNLSAKVAAPPVPDEVFMGSSIKPIIEFYSR